MRPIAPSESNLDDLQMLPNSIYLDPQLSWRDPVALTYIEFINSTKLGEKYNNMLLIGDYNQGNLYIVSLDKKERNFIRWVQYTSFRQSSWWRWRIQFAYIGTDFGGISDKKTGPDGYLYVLSFNDSKLYMIFK